MIPCFIGSAHSGFHHLTMVNVNVERVFGGRIVLAIFRQHLPDDVRDEEGVATRVTADGVGQLGVVILHMLKIDSDGHLERSKIMLNDSFWM